MPRYQHVIVVCSLALWACLASSPQLGWAADGSSPVPRSHSTIGPPGTNTRSEQASRSLSTTLFTSLLTFFQKVISPVDGDRCPSYPTCAAYSKQAYEKHGALLGTLMTVDRLIHEASEHEFSPTVKVYGVNRIYDPVSANEFWLRHRPDQTDQSGR